METNIRHEKFIEEMIQHGDRAKAYRAAYPEATHVHTSAHRLASDPDIIARIEEGRQKLAAEARMREEEEYYIRIAAITKKRALLSRIINSETKFEKLVKTEDGYQTIPVPPTASEIFRAIELDNKLAKEMGVLTDKVRFTVEIDGEQYK